MSKLAFFAELRRRNVYRAAVFYAGAAWLLVQIATQVFPFFDIPNRAVRVVVIAALIGFPFAMLFSWFYEWTPEGIKRESEIDRSESITRQTGKTLDRWIIAVLGLAVVLLLTDKFALRKDASAITDKSIAVLPLANSTGDPANEYFSDGVSEELISSLSRLSNLKVIGRTSSFQFKGKTEDSKTIGEKLGVVYLLEGSVRKSANRVRISVELVKSADGASVWSETYDRELKDIFAVQSEIAGAVASQLKVALLGNNAHAAQTPTAATPSNRNVEAYNALLQGNYYFLRQTADDFHKAIGYYEEAIRLDPRYALAYAKLSAANTLLNGNFGGPEATANETRKKARAAADTALALEPALGEAHYARGLILAPVDLNLAEAEYRRAAELSPQDANTARALCTLNASFGRLDQAVDFGRRAVVLDPLSSASRFYLARALTGQGAFDEAEATLRKAIELQPQASHTYMQLATLQILRGNAAAAIALAQQETDPFWRNYALALAYFAHGDRAEADAQLKKLIDENAYSGGSQIAIVYALRKEPDKMFEWLEHARLAKDPGTRLLLVDPFLLAYRNDPRFIAFARKTGVMPATDTSRTE